MHGPGRTRPCPCGGPASRGLGCWLEPAPPWPRYLLQRVGRREPGEAAGRDKGSGDSSASMLRLGMTEARMGPRNMRTGKSWMLVQRETAVVESNGDGPCGKGKGCAPPRTKPSASTSYVLCMYASTGTRCPCIKHVDTTQNIVIVTHQTEFQNVNVIRGPLQPQGPSSAEVPAGAAVSGQC